jgi:hypothetical protein
MADDSWRYTQQIWIDEDDTAGDLVFRLRKPDTLQTIRIWNLDTYGTFNELEILIGGEARRWNPPNVRHLDAEVTGIRVGRKADVLYFVHTAHVGGPIAERERERINDRKRPFELPVVMKYVLHYRDGETREIPVTLERHIDHWIQPKPRPLFEARVGWHKPLPALDGRHAVLYSMQATNPRPDVEIQSIEVVRTSDRAVPAVLGITPGDIIH